MTLESLFPHLPASARVWIHTADRTLSAEEMQSLLDRIEPFLRTWSSHRRAVAGAATVFNGRFLILAAHVEGGDLSGCGIDKSVHEIETLGRSLGIDWLPALQVAWEDPDGRVQTGSRAEFRAAVVSGTVTHETPVYDPSLTSLESIRAGRFVLKAEDSWHARVFGLARPGTISA